MSRRPPTQSKPSRYQSDFFEGKWRIIDTGTGQFIKNKEFSSKPEVDTEIRRLGQEAKIK